VTRSVNSFCKLAATFAIVGTTWLPIADANAAPRVVVLDVELTGDLGGPEFTKDHEARIKMASARLREKLTAQGSYELMDSSRAQPSVDRLSTQHRYLHNCGDCAAEIGRDVGADVVLVTWVYRVSNLILTLNYAMTDVATGQTVKSKSFDFRGDNDVAWGRAIDYMVRDLKSEEGK